MMKLITLRQKEEWNTYIKESLNYDFYHTWSYHALDNGGEPILFVYQEKVDFIAFPLIKRAIPNTNFFDLGSVYGYTGPLSNKKFEDLDQRMIDNFKNSFLEYVEKQNVVSIFARLHPFLDQNFLIQKFGSLYKNGKTVAIDLDCTIENQRKNYRETTAKHIRRCVKKGYFIKETKKLKDIEAFFNIYSENMERVGSADFYFFNKQHFIKLLNADEIDCRLVLAYADDKIISGQIIACTNGIVQAYLLGTVQEYLKESPAKFLFDQISVIGRKLGMKYYHLGGGLGFKEDSLFDWKAGFSDLFLNYNSWRYIVNQNVYEELVHKTGNDINDTIDFFPLYRLLPQQA